MEKGQFLGSGCGQSWVDHILDPMAGDRLIKVMPVTGGPRSLQERKGSNSRNRDFLKPMASDPGSSKMGGITEVADG